MKRQAAALLDEWLEWWFDGSPKTVNGTLYVFPSVQVRWDQDAIEQPLDNAIEMRGYVDPQSREVCAADGGWLVSARVLVHFYVRVNRTDGQRANYEANQVADLLHGILASPECRSALAVKGVQHLNPRPPLTLSSDLYKLRLVTTTARLQYTVKE